uniref:triple tyrosine motif-containing protein n=1 Tax=Fulvivirga sp. TaxID=1931237 RepID=UPI00404AD5C3
NKGIAVFDKKEYRVVKIFYGYHGLQGDEFNTKAYFKSPSGKMYFGGVSGLTSFLPTDALEIASEIPKAILTGLFINGQKQKQTLNSFSLSQIVETGKVELDWNERNFGFEVSSLGFSYPAHTSYQYKLEGYENIWTFIEKEHRIQFTNIPPGEYKLRIKASNSFGEWEKEGLVISIIISHPFWRTIWFISTVIVIIVLTITFIFQLRT